MPIGGSSGGGGFEDKPLGAKGGYNLDAIDFNDPNAMTGGKTVLVKDDGAPPKKRAPPARFANKAKAAEPTDDGE